MKKEKLIAIIASLVFFAGMLLPAFGQEMKSIQLPEPKFNESKSLAQALKDRKTTRTYALDNLSEQTLSSLLWSACGINRPDSGRRTAPSAKNWQEIEVYVATTTGMYL